MIEQDDYPPDPPLSSEQRARADSLTPEQVQMIDDTLLSYVVRYPRKVARIVGSALIDLKDKGLVTNIPDIFFAERVRHLLSKGLIQGEGDFTRMGRSEVRLP